jgi:aryl-phospho-beta-D-glucosidase BglC (GH1 family)
MFLAALCLCLVSAGAKVQGVNYGNRFIPEDWMAKSPYDFFEGLSSPAKRLSLGDVIDVSGKPAKRRMLDWLEATIQEEDFQKMADLGVKILRVPCGYWNWISYAGDSTPSAPAVDSDGFHVVQQLKNLQSIAAPQDYRPYFDRIFEYAASHGIQVLLDLHGLPGSQNGEIHSGIVTGSGDHPKYYFETDWNRQQAIAAVDAMAEYGASKANLFGLQVINEPQSDISHDFLAEYYRQAIGKARQHLAQQVPVVLFSWTYDFQKWADNAFDFGTYGSVLWDTHVYHMGAGSLKDMKAANWADYESVRDFAARGNRVFVGEWTVAGMSGVDDSQLQSFAAWFVRHFECVAEGSLFWSFDGPGTWGFAHDAAHVEWAQVFSTTSGSLRGDGAAFGLRTFHGGWVSASTDGRLSSSDSKSQWEEWTPLVYTSGGSTKLALPSWPGHWLSAAEDGTLTAHAESHSSWEEFTPYMYEQDGRHFMALQSFHGKWITVTPNGEISATADSHSAWEQLLANYCSDSSLLPSTLLSV